MKLLSADEAARLVKQYQIADYFDTPDLPFQAFQYQKGEILSSPLNPLGHLLFLVCGSVRIYLMCDNGRSQLIAPVSGAHGQIFGDMEFACGSPTPFFSEVMKESVCLALSLADCGDLLHRDVRFLHYILRSMGEKVNFNFALGIGGETLEDRVLSWFLASPDGLLTNVKETAQRLRCSRRQLQRLLKEMCDGGTVIRTARGQYRLVDAKNTDRRL